MDDTKFWNKMSDIAATLRVPLA